MGFTSGLDYAGTDVSHAVTIGLADGVTKLSLLPNLPEQDYQKHKGDLWKISFKDDFLLNYCVMKYDIRSIAIMENGDDGWNIETIVTFIKSGNDYELATSDFHVNHWIDGNRKGDSHRRLDLTLVF